MDPKVTDTAAEDDYDEAADSDFAEEKLSDRSSSSSSEDDNGQASPSQSSRPRTTARPPKSKKPTVPLELDSGDEATIKQRNKSKRRKQQEASHDQRDDASDVEEQGWRARTRAMRERDQNEQRHSRLASVKGSTIDVDKMWEMMNQPSKPVALRDVQVESDDDQNIGRTHTPEPAKHQITLLSPNETAGDDDDGNNMITIEESYEFAGEIHTRKKLVAGSSSEAKAWLSRQPTRNTDQRFSGPQPIRRPLRRLSRFDPNLYNPDLFRPSWHGTSENATTTTIASKKAAPGPPSKVPKITTVAKSKMDWTAHVEREDGLRDELSEHAKAKDGYLGRMDFLDRVERKKEDKRLQGVS
jgi:hypothetical protein